MRALVAARQGKGTQGVVKRARSIVDRYGFTADKSARGLEGFVQVLRQFGCGATFPIPATTLAGNRRVLDRFLGGEIEFAVHGYAHVDHTRLPADQQLKHLQRARRLFGERGIAPLGFRAPYLRCNKDTLAAVREAGFLYDASMALAWDLGQGIDTREYRRALSFYGAVSAAEHPSLPRRDDGLVRIPYCVPDDEALVERLQLESEESMSRPWLDVLEKTYRLGELFSLGLHPERFPVCEAALVATLRRASAMKPHVWIARLEDIAAWWIAREKTEVFISDRGGELIHVSVRGPEGLTILARAVEVRACTADPWDGTAQVVRGNEFELRAPRRPFVGVSPRSCQRLVSFLRQQGYIVERTENGQEYSLFLDRRQFEETDERPLLALIEDAEFALVRLGRWPHGARSALCISGDIDALTLWDYAARFLPA